MRRAMLASALFAALLGSLAPDAFAQRDGPTVTVAITAPADGAVMGGPATVTLTAAARVDRQNWSIQQVEYYSGTTLIGTATAAPYTFQWTDLTPGFYTLTAKASANPTQMPQRPNASNMPTWEGVSAPVAIRVNAPPTVSLTTPANNALYAGPATNALSPAAADATGNIVKVDFYQGTTLIGTSTTAPYVFSWTDVTPGIYRLTAVATNDAAQITTSSAVNVRVNSPPNVNLTAPANNAVYAGPANVTLTANPTDVVGIITKVEFFQGGAFIGSTNAAPYSFNWAGVTPGVYSLTALATNDAGQSTTSTAVNVTVDA